MRWLFKFVLGSKRYVVHCSNPSVKAGQLMSEFPETVYDVKVTGDFEIEFSCLALLSKRVVSYLESTECEITEKLRYGLPFRLKKTIKKPGLILGLVIALLTVYYQSGTVWDITITGNEKIGIEEIESTLSEVGFSIGRPYKTKKLASICNRFILLDNRFSRIAINMSGNAAFIEVTERAEKKNIENIPSKSGIIASKDCVIERPEVYSGTALVKKGDTIEKGTVIISPVELGGDGKEYISGALGKVYARTIEDFMVIVSYEDCVTEFDSEISLKNIFSFLGMKFKINSFKDEKSENYVCLNELKRVRINENTVLPIKVRTTRKIGYSNKYIKISPEKTSEKAYKAMYEKISRELYDSDILSTTFLSEQTEKEFILRCRVECIRDVAQRIE
ncbi:MAG: sporulation protein YqfD [Clostridia bacterium]|nr:sporulation protein YqfD [Clostridia bacterium]